MINKKQLDIKRLQLIFTIFWCFNRYALYNNAITYDWFNS